MIKILILGIVSPAATEIVRLPPALSLSSSDESPTLRLLLLLVNALLIDEINPNTDIHSCGLLSTTFLNVTVMSIFIIYAISRFSIRYRACRLRNLDLFRLTLTISHKVSSTDQHSIKMNQLTYDNFNPGDDFKYCTVLYCSVKIIMSRTGRCMASFTQIKLLISTSVVR